MPYPNNSTLVRTPSVRELCKEKAVKYSRIKCVVFQEGGTGELCPFRYI